ncbi:acyl-CoA thioester hydrolase [Virgisporangium aliadipatigenens]|uniref:Acyl-CoA thioester hydrolase n=1 Tax=Virgisporangium aliadipatigenens TaxID=741659 RepID=A0A8J3YQ53_9ACTN|nr:alpha/beta hydrolase [Virgisporangium aliadipatigenens]GIJ47856.1 acyl-CoA thioester hydrolase [Virgisporangium aliadipatigenens]
MSTDAHARDVDLTVPADDGLPLAGTLTLPAGPAPHPAVVFLSGSGRLDRDSAAGRLRTGLAGAFAAALAARGIATLRYDRRGVAATPGDWLATGFAHNRDDAHAAVRALAGRPEIRADAVGVVGHSEGALHAMWLAAHAPVAAAVLLAGFARPGDEAVRWQGHHLAAQLPGPLRPAARRVGRRALRRITTGAADVVRVGGLRVNARWYRELLAFDPAPVLRAVRVPALALTGEKDLQCDPDDLDAMARLAPGITTRRVPDLTHVLRRDPRPPTLRAYRRLLREPVDAEVLETVTDWLGAHLATTARPHGSW